MVGKNQTTELWAADQNGKNLQAKLERSQDELQRKIQEKLLEEARERLHRPSDELFIKDHSQMTDLGTRNARPTQSAVGHGPLFQSTNRSSPLWGSIDADQISVGAVQK